MNMSRLPRHFRGLRPAQYVSPTVARKVSPSETRNNTIEQKRSHGAEGRAPLWALVKNWSVIPCDSAKHPLVKWRLFQNRPATKNELFTWSNGENTFRGEQPVCWGVVTGAISGLVILDFDGEAGLATMKRLGFPPHVKTGSGGFHLYLQHPGWRVATLNHKSKAELGERWPGLDIRADGGYAVFAGQSAKGTYTWRREPAPDSLDILPGELREFLGLLESPEDCPAVTAPAHATSLPSAMPLLERALAKVNAGEGRNNSGFWLICQLRDSGFSKDKAGMILRDFVSQCPTFNTKGQPELYLLGEAMKSLRSAFITPPRKAWK